MSFDINWSLLKDTELAATVLNVLNDYFARVERPSFIGPISMLEFDFGDLPPEVEIVNLTEPWPEFYASDADDDNDTETGASRSFSNEPTELWVPTDFSSDPGTFDGSHYLRRFGRSSNFDAESVGTGSRRGETDVQLEVAVRYKGNMSLKIATELIINQPTEAFLTLPMTLTLTSLTFSAVAVMAYLRDRIVFCLKHPAPSSQFLEDFAIDSEIGDGNRQVLKNVGKIERFVVDQLRKACLLVTFPSFTVFELFMPDPEQVSEDDVEID
ncbi:hypothetical protein DFJ74DRAFT_709709 [Hyaloraphidium curvatum]|nr:hypothetical protein DFJ74DRAFT_709709 [Hyaloraphidium curvatum]